jgi:hypothetical protein
VLAVSDREIERRPWMRVVDTTGGALLLPWIPPGAIARRPERARISRRIRWRTAIPKDTPGDVEMSPEGEETK